MAHFTKLRSLKRKPRSYDGPAVDSYMDHREYPAGCCVRLSEEDLEALDLDLSDFSVGDVVHLCCDTEVMAADGEHGKRLVLQITDMECGDVEDEPEPSKSNEDRAGSRYDDEKAEGED